MANSGVELIAAERRRQIEVEGWTPEHDAQHFSGELTEAAICYANLSSALVRWPWKDVNAGCQHNWPWSPTWWKPSPVNIRNLVKAGALIAAEIDRLQRKTEAQ